METKIKNKLIEDLQDNRELKNTIKLEGSTDYNVNAVTAEVAKHTKADLTINSSLASGITSATFDGSNDKTINYVPSTGGKFDGYVFLTNEHGNSVAGVALNELVNYGQIETAISKLNGAPLYTWDASSKELTAVKDAAKIPYQLNTVVGKTADLAALAARENDNKNDEYLQEENENGNNIDGHVTYTNAGVATGIKTGDNATDIAILGNYNSPTNYVKIGAQAFKDKTQLEWVHINPGVTEIGEAAFAGCKNLSYITIPDSIKSIGERAFENCPYLNTVDLSRGINEIKSRTFAIDSDIIPTELIQYGNYGITSITIGYKVTKIASDAFEGCDNIAHIYFTGTEAAWNKITDENGGSNPLTQIDATVHFENIEPFPFLYICDDGETDTTLTSNKMFLKMPGEPLIEVSKGAVRLERPSLNPNSDNNYKYYTYDGLAEIIARINKRLAAIDGGTETNTLKITDSAVKNATIHELDEIEGVSTEDIKDITPPITLNQTVAELDELKDIIAHILTGDCDEESCSIADCTVYRATNVGDITKITKDSQNNDISDNTIAFSIGDNSFEKTVNNVAHATEATNVDEIKNNDSGDNANVKFSIGDNSFEKTVNNVAHATNAKTLDENPSLSADGNKIKVTAGGKTSSAFTVPYATTANKVNNTLSIQLNSGTATEFNGSEKKEINITPNNIGTYTTNEIDEKINAEALAREAADDALNAAVLNEAAERAVADSALDEKISAIELTDSKVLLSGPFTLTQDFGYYKLNGAASKSFGFKDQPLHNFLQGAFAQEDTTIFSTAPYCNINISGGSYEVGSTVTPSASWSTSAGKYKWGTYANGVANYNDKSTGITYNTGTISFTETSFVIGDSSVTVTASGTAERSAVTKYPCSNLGSDLSDSLAAEYRDKKTLTPSNSATYTSFRRGFYGTLNTKSAPIDDSFSNILRDKALITGYTDYTPYTSDTWELRIPEGAIRVVFAYPASIGDVSSVVDAATKYDVKTSFTKYTINVNGASSGYAMAYNVYISDFANANTTANTYTITI